MEFKKGESTTFYISEWLANEKGLETTKIEGTVKATTRKAVLISFDEDNEEWFPFSQSSNDPISYNDGRRTVRHLLSAMLSDTNPIFDGWEDIEMDFMGFD